MGTGIFGLASAYHIKKNSPGKRVLAIDRFADVAQGNTGRSNAMFRNMFTSGDNRELANATIDFYTHVQRDMKVDIGVDPIGYLWLMSERQLSTSSHHVDSMEENGVQVVRYGARDLGEMIPGLALNQAEKEESRLMNLEDVAGAYFGPKCGRLAPEKLARFYKERFLDLGGDLIFGADAKSLIVDATVPTGLEGEPFLWQDSRVAGVRLSDGGEIRAATTVVAAGAWTNELLDPTGIDGHAKSKMRQLFTVPAQSGSALARLLHTKGFNPSGTIPFLILPKGGVIVKPMSEQAEFWVGGEDEVNRQFLAYPEEDIDANYPPERAYYEMSIHPVLRAYLPDFAGAGPSRMWSGLYSYNTVDNLPYVFEGDGLVVVGGDSGSGVMKGDSLGRVVDAVYRNGEETEVELFGGATYRASKLGFRKRDVEREDWLL
ncbi:MAG: FAD-binding oxidoreductase [Thaumarchaeota archaeon]|nr:FAD-binding oxidoreductase [Nitrososphaerota archaeon]